MININSKNKYFRGGNNWQKNSFDYLSFLHYGIWNYNNFSDQKNSEKTI